MALRTQDGAAFCRPASLAMLATSLAIDWTRAGPGRAPGAGSTRAGLLPAAGGGTPRGHHAAPGADAHLEVAPSLQLIGKFGAFDGVLTSAK